MRSPFPGLGHGYDETQLEEVGGRVAIAILDENVGTQRSRRWAIEDRIHPPTLATHVQRIIGLRYEVAA